MYIYHIAILANGTENLSFEADLDEHIQKF